MIKNIFILLISEKIILNLVCIQHANHIIDQNEA